MNTNILTTALALGLALPVNTYTAEVPPAEAQKIAKDAYIFCFPLNYYYPGGEGLILESFDFSDP